MYSRVVPRLYGSSLGLRYPRTSYVTDALYLLLSTMSFAKDMYEDDSLKRDSFECLDIALGDVTSDSCQFGLRIFDVSIIMFFLRGRKATVICAQRSGFVPCMSPSATVFTLQLVFPEIQ